MFVNFSSRRQFTADGIMSTAYGTLGNKNLESSWKLRCKKQDITWLIAPLIRDPRSWHDKAKGRRAEEANKLMRWINKLWAEVRSSNDHPWDGVWCRGRTHRNYKTLPSLLQHTRQCNTWVLIGKPTGCSLPLFEMKHYSPLQGGSWVGRAHGLPALRGRGCARQGGSGQIRRRPLLASCPSATPWGLGLQQPGPDQNPCPSTPGVLPALGLEPPPPNWTRLEDGERRRAECLVKLQDDPPDPTAAWGWAVGCWPTGSGKRSCSAGEHTGNKRRLRPGSPPQAGLEDSRGSRRWGAFTRLHGIPAAHSVPGLWFHYLENNRAGLDSAQGPSQCSRSRDPGGFKSQLQRSTQNVLTSVHWNPCHSPARVLVNIWSKRQHFFKSLKRSSQLCPNWWKPRDRQTDPDSLAEEAGVWAEVGSERQNRQSGSTSFPGQAQGHLQASGLTVPPNNATHRACGPDPLLPFFSLKYSWCTMSYKLQVYDSQLLKVIFHLWLKNPPANAGDMGSGRSPGEGNGNPLQYSCLENPMDRGAWWATVHGVTRVGHDLVTKHQLHL